MAKKNKSKVPMQPWDIRYYKRHKQDDPEEHVPAQEFRKSCPPNVRAEIDATLHAVAERPPPMFSGGLRWKPMHGDMAGWFEVRVKSGKLLYRVFCLLEREAAGLRGPSIILIEGMSKENETAFSKADYDRVRDLGNKYRARTPRSVT
jgi:hypothetical protein